MSKLTILATIAVLIISASAYAVVPDLMVGGVVVDDDFYRNSPVTLSNASSDDYVDVGFWLMNDLDYKGDHDNRFMKVGDSRSSRDKRFNYGDVRFRGRHKYDSFFDGESALPEHDNDDEIKGLYAIPEPGTLFLLGSGLIGMGLVIRRRRRY